MEEWMSNLSEIAAFPGIPFYQNSFVAESVCFSLPRCYPIRRI